MNQITLTSLEKRVLKALQAEHASRKFGVMERVAWKKRNQLGGVVSHLLYKGVVTNIEKVTVKDKIETRYTLHHDHRG